MFKKHLATLAAILLISQSIEASVPLRKAFNYPQNDGTHITALRQGDRGYSFYATSDGLAIMKGTDGGFYYATKTSDGLKASPILAHNKGDRNEAERTFIENEALTTEACHNHIANLKNPYHADTKALYTSNNGLGSYGKPASGVIKSIGSPNIPIVLVEFSDCKFFEEHTMDKYMRWFNKTDYDEEEFCKGSVAQYYSSQSDSLFTPSFTVVAKVCMSKGYAYYGADSSSSSTDKNENELTKEILDSLNAQGINLTPFVQEDIIPLITFLHAGPGQQSSFDAESDDYIYAHFRENPRLNYNEKTIGSYLFTCEILQNYVADDEGNPVMVGQQIDGIGTFCHEFNHALGLPDFYSTRGTDVETPTMWSIMDYGQYQYDGYCPAGFGAYERSCLGWLEIEELDNNPAHKELYALDTKNKPTAYLLRNDANAKEYFVLENRQPGLWFPSMYGAGMLVTHIDYEQSAWSGNIVNINASHPRVSIIRADNAFQDATYEDVYKKIQGDLYPGPTNNTELSDESVPAMTVYTGEKLGKPIYNISLSKEGIISFSYLDKNVTALDEIATNTATSATYYTIDGRKVTNLAPGIYIKVADSKVEKLLVK